MRGETKVEVISFGRVIGGLVLICLSGCVSVAVEGANAAKSKAVISNNLEAAQAGDAEAQFKVGKAYCCSLNEGEAIYDTPTSVRWLCSSAKQGYGPAMIELGKIYSGDLVDGIRLAARAAHAVKGSSTNLPVAWAWFINASKHEQADGEELAGEVLEEMDEAQSADARALYPLGLDVPCGWDEVIQSTAQSEQG